MYRLAISEICFFFHGSVIQLANNRERTIRLIAVTEVDIEIDMVIINLLAAVVEIIIWS